MIKPFISSAFWGSWDKLYSNQTLEELIEKGGYIINNQLLPFDQAMEEWTVYFDLD